MKSAVHAAAAVGFATALAAQSPPQLLLLDRNYLTDVGRNFSSAIAAAKRTLVEEADKALAMKPVSVMDKAVTPPSGDKHDYMSQAPYFWPDPKKPDGKPYIRRDGERNPEINRISDHENLGRVISAVSTLGLAHFFSGRDEYAAQAARLVRVWFIDPATRMNPHLNFGQGIPGITEGRGIGIIETRGLPDLLDGVLLISDSKAWTPADEAALQAWMRSYLTWLIESPHGKAESKNGNNHETYYDVQVAALALYTHQPELARRTLTQSRERIGRQIEPDGGMPRELERTRSWDYSIMNLSGFMALATLGERAGVDLWSYRTADGRSIRQALDFLVPYAAGDRKWTRDQITTFRASALYVPLRRAAAAWKDPKYAALAGKIGGATWKTDLTIAPLR
jgi:alginate lyase